ncbi:adenylate/guanylate cyclase domain-containing protein [bacterium]|nr:adenylate/guanylate cyclase domain-containing protein [bacterium]
MPRRRRKIDEKQEQLEPKAVREQDEQDRDIVILFADVVGCSEVSNHKTLKKYNNFISSFQECFTKVCEHYRDTEYATNNKSFFDYQARGDEGCLKIFVPDREDLSVDIDNAINIALDLKRKWLLGQENELRINSGLLPVDMGIGIHAGKVWVNEEKGDTKYRPEGYAINLAKRIESESRGGKFSHILISESARGELYLLKDEYTYRFGKPFTISPKGISHDIKVFEIMHHFLPTDWNDVKKPSEVAMIYDELKDDSIDDKVLLAKKAYNLNPMNLWLAEEYVLLWIMNAHKRLDKKGKAEDYDAVKEEYATALKVTRQIANSNLRDAGVLALLGFILGEQKDYLEEQQMYKEGIKLDEQDGLLHWYLAYSISCKLDDDQKKQKKTDINDFFKNNKEKIEKTLNEYKRALELMPANPWITYDYACEESWWSQVDKKRFRKTAIERLIPILIDKAEIREKAKEEPYLEPMIDDPKLKPYLK